MDRADGAPIAAESQAGGGPAAEATQPREPCEVAPSPTPRRSFPALLLGATCTRPVAPVAGSRWLAAWAVWLALTALILARDARLCGGVERIPADLDRGYALVGQHLADTPNILSFIAAADHPENFAADGLLSDPKRFAFYIPFHRWLIRTLSWRTDQPIVGMWLLAALLQPVAFYTHFRLLYYLSGRYWVCLCGSIIAVAPFWFGLTGDYYGTWGLRTMVPRSVFVALYPLPLLWCMQFRNGWAAVLGFAGLGALANVHPVSAPGLLAASLMAYLGCASPAPTRRLLRCGLFAAVALLAASPYIVTWVLHLPDGAGANLAYDKLIELFRYRNPTYGDPDLAMRRLYELLRSAGMLVLLIGWAAGLMLWWLRGRLDDAWKFALTTYLGTIVIALAGAAVLAYECRAARVVPAYQSIVRGLRFLAPLLLVGHVALLAIGLEAADAVSRRRSRRAGWALRGTAALLMPVVLYWAWSPRAAQRQVWIQDWADLGTYGFGPACQAARDTAEAYRWIRSHTDRDAAFLGDRVVRAACVRSVVLDRGDIHVLLYGDLHAAARWQNRMRGLEQVEGFANRYGASTALGPRLCLAAKLGADYVCEHAAAPSQPWPGRVPFHNAHYTIYDTRDGALWFDEDGFALWRRWTTRSMQDYVQRRREQLGPRAARALWITNSPAAARAVAATFDRACGVYAYVPASGALYYYWSKRRGQVPGQTRIAIVPPAQASGQRLLHAMAAHANARGTLAVTLIWQDPPPPQIRARSAGRDRTLPDADSERYALLMQGEPAEVHATWQAYEATWRVPGRPPASSRGQGRPSSGPQGGKIKR